MQIGLTKTMSLLAASTTLLAVTPAMAQQVRESPPTVAPAESNIWASDEGTLLHKPSGAICPAALNDLALIGKREYAPDGSDVSCEYSGATPSGNAKLSLYIYSHPEYTIAQQWGGAKAAISRTFESGTVPGSASENETESKQCFSAIAPMVKEAADKRAEKDGKSLEDKDFQFGVVIFDMTIGAGDKERKAKTLLSLQQAGNWSVKVRATVYEDTQEASLAACRLSAFSHISQTAFISTK